MRFVGQIFLIKRVIIGKISGCFKKGGITYFHIKQPFPVFLSVW